MRNISLLAIHPNFELYGSDRSFANALTALIDRTPGLAVTALLPKRGPIVELPIFSRIPLLIAPFWIPRRSDLPPHRLPLFLMRGLSRIAAARRRMAGYDINYINTIISLDFIIAARFSKRPTVIHAREIPTGREMMVFRRLLALSRATVIFNSAATRDAFALSPDQPGFVVHNGADDPGETRTEWYQADRPLRVLMIGRINAWKGQGVLVDAISRLSADRAKIEVRIVGGVFGAMDHFREELAGQIDAAGLGDTISILPFSDRPGDAYAWADVAVVPSTKPEPFGRVAIEAMAYSCPVIASGHGGLTEIVVDGETGRLVPPSDADALAGALQDYIHAPGRVSADGARARARFLDHFTNEASDRKLAKIFHTILDNAGLKRPDQPAQ